MESNKNQLTTSFSIQRLAHFLIVVAILSYFLIIAQPILAPIAFASFFALMLKPICDYFDRYTNNDAFSVLLSFLVVMVPLAILFFIFSFQVVTIFDDLTSISEKLRTGADQLVNWLYAQGRKSGLADRAWVDEKLTVLFEAPIGFVKSGISSTATFVAGLAISILYIFFFLYYRKGIKNFAIMQFQVSSQENVREVFSKIQDIAQKYLYGLGMVILIMGALNSLGLFLIGIEYALLWGFLAAFLTVVPYVGTVIGGLLPFLYAAATTDTYWQPIMVAAYYLIIQQIEGNFITPKVIGNSVKINPMVAILSLIVGGYIWGVAGLILSLPMVAMIRIVFQEIDWLKPVALLMSNELYKKEEKFETYNTSKFRISKIFKTRKLKDPKP